MRLSPSRPPLACWIAGVVLVALSGCATTQRPVLYPNAKYKQVGEQTARRDIDDCMRLAEESGIAHGGGERAARRTAEGAAVGGAAGAATGIVRGRDVGERAATGAAAGAAAGAVHGAVRSDQPGQVYKGFVQRCLRERGYDVIGWQ